MYSVLKLIAQPEPRKTRKIFKQNLGFFSFYRYKLTLNSLRCATSCAAMHDTLKARKSFFR